MKRLIDQQQATGQRGAVSPFMFGLLMSITLLSTMMQYHAAQQLEQVKAQQQQEAVRRAEDVKRAVENAILTEHVDHRGSEQRFFDLDALKGHLTGSTGLTQSGGEITINQTETTSRYGGTNRRILIQAGDNQRKHDHVSRQFDADDALSNIDNTTIVIDTDDIRSQQIARSQEYLEREAAQIYRAYVVNRYTFPDPGQYQELVNDITGLKDAWGQPFNYQKQSAKKATLSFTAPWGYTFKKTLSME